MDYHRAIDIIAPALVTMVNRIDPAKSPFEPGVQQWLDRIVPGREPLVLFTTLARDPRLFAKFFAGGLLDKGHLALRERELVIDRTTARCGSEYEWGVHIQVFGESAGFTCEQVRSFVDGGPQDPCWTEDDRLLIVLSDALFEHCDIDDELWERLRSRFSPEGITELIMLAGFYRTVSYLTRSFKLPLEKGAARFPGKR